MSAKRNFLEKNYDRLCAIGLKVYHCEIFRIFIQYSSSMFFKLYTDFGDASFLYNAKCFSRKKDSVRQNFAKCEKLNENEINV